MNIKFVEIKAGTCFEIRKASVKVDGKFQRKVIVAIHTHYGNKDELKVWCNERGGTWNPTPGDSFWWVLFTKENVQALPLLSFWNGVFLEPENENESQKEKARRMIRSALKEKVVPSNVVYGIKSVFSTQENDYMECSVFYERIAEDYLPQMQGYVVLKDLKGKSEETRVVIHPSEPSDKDKTNGKDADLEWGHYWRKFQDEDGNTLWCLPWINPSNRSAMGGWPDFIEDSKEEKPPEIEESTPIDMVVRLAVDKDTDEPIGLRVTIKAKGTNRFYSCKQWCDGWKESKFNWDTKEWEVPYSERVLADLKWFLGDKFIAKFSDRLTEMMETIEAEMAR
jgi:hypothetical protein